MSQDDEPESRLARSLHELQRARSAPAHEQGASRVAVSSELAAYLRYLEGEEVGYVRVISADVGHADVALADVYTPTKVNAALSVEVDGSEIKDAWLEGVDTTHVDEAALQGLIDVIGELMASGVDQRYPDVELRPLLLAPPWEDGRKEAFWKLDAMDAAAVFPRLVVLGPPGSGKSTLARYIGLTLARDRVGQSLPTEWTSGQHLAGAQGGLTPVFVELRRLVEWEGFPALDHAVSEADLWRYIETRLDRAHLSYVSPALRRELLEGRACVILDGIDEIPVPPGEAALRARRTQLAQLARSVATVYGGSRIIFTARTYAYEDWALPGFTDVTLDPVDMRTAGLLLRTLGRLRGLGGRDSDRETAALLQALQDVPQAIKEYPLFLTLLAALWWHGTERSLPATRSQLYRESIDLLLLRWADDERGELPLTVQLGCDVPALYRRLEIIAYDTQASQSHAGATTTTINFATLVTELFRLGEAVDSRKVLAYLTDRAGVLVAREHEAFAFAHRGYQEYLAASHLRREVEAALATGDTEIFERIRALMAGNPLNWREPLLLLGDLVRSGERPRDIWAVIEWLIGDEDDEAGADQWCVWLCARYVLDHKLIRDAPKSERRNAERLRRLLADSLESGSLTVAERVDVGTALGTMGDPRSGAGLRAGLPEIAWCEVPEGKFRMGTAPADEVAMEEASWARGWGFSREMPGFVLWLPTFWISRFPITRAQFGAFLDDPAGYRSDEWWAKMPPEARTRSERRRDEVQNHPQTFVSWYDAVAFCRWFSARSGQEVDLPTEAEWEKGARTSDGRLFAWGNEFLVDRCNTNASGFGRVVPVGIYGDRVRVDEPRDMSGNVWEWCSSLGEARDKVFSYPYSPDDGRESRAAVPGERRVVRGGSYVNPPFLARVAYRGRDRPSGGLGRTGFRVVRRMRP